MRASCSPLVHATVCCATTSVAGRVGDRSPSGPESRSTTSNSMRLLQTTRGTGRPSHSSRARGVSRQQPSHAQFWLRSSAQSFGLESNRRCRHVPPWSLSRSWPASQGCWHLSLARVACVTGMPSSSRAVSRPKPSRCTLTLAPNQPKPIRSSSVSQCEPGVRQTEWE